MHSPEHSCAQRGPLPDADGAGIHPASWALTHSDPAKLGTLEATPAPPDPRPCLDGTSRASQCSRGLARGSQPWGHVAEPGYAPVTGVEGGMPRAQQCRGPAPRLEMVRAWMSTPRSQPGIGGPGSSTCRAAAGAPAYGIPGLLWSEPHPAQAPKSPQHSDSPRRRQHPPGRDAALALDTRHTPAHQRTPGSCQTCVS